MFILIRYDHLWLEWKKESTPANHKAGTYRFQSTLSWARVSGSWLPPNGPFAAAGVWNSAYGDWDIVLRPDGRKQDYKTPKITVRKVLYCIYCTHHKSHHDSQTRCIRSEASARLSREEREPLSPLLEHVMSWSRHYIVRYTKRITWVSINWRNPHNRRYK